MARTRSGNPAQAWLRAAPLREFARRSPLLSVLPLAAAPQAWFRVSGLHSAELIAALSGAGLVLWRLAAVLRHRPRSSWADDLPARILVIDFRPLEQAFADLRDRGVDNCNAHLGREPAELARLVGMIRIRHASQSTLRDLGARSTGELDRERPRLSRPPYAAALRFLIESLWAGRELVEDEYSYLDDGGNERVCLMRACVPGGGRDWSGVVLMLADLTASKSGGGLRLESQELVQRVLGQADILVWWAKVRREGDRLHWKVHVPGRTDGCELYRLATAVEGGGLWSGEHAPDFDEMERTARRAILGGSSRYQHEFRIRAADRLHWLAEDVAIQRLGDDEWSLMGVVTDVSGRHEADEARRRSEALVRQMLERADCMLWQGRVSARADGGFDWVCDAPLSHLLQRLFGRSEPIHEGPIYDDSDVYPDKKDMDALSSRALLEGWPGYEQTVRIVRDGRTYWLHEQVSIRPVAPGSWSLIGVAIDVTDRHRAEEERRRADDRFRQILIQVDCLVWQARVEGRPERGLTWSMYVPPSNLYRKLFEHDPLNNGEAELWSVVQVPELAEMNARARDALRMGLSSYEQEFHVIGSEKIYRLREVVSIVPAGPSVWNVAGVVTDLTERWEAERALAEEKERLAVTLEAMEEAVVNADIHGRILFMNRSASRMLGRPADLLVGLPFATVFHWESTRSGDLALGLFERAAACERPLELPDDVHLKTAHAGSIPVEGCFAPVRDSEGRNTGVVLVVRDVSERQRLESQMLRASKLESVALLAGGIAHDFNNILTAILANLSLALVDSSLDPDVMHSLRDAEGAAMRARDLTRQLLTFAKGGDPVRTAVQLADFLRATAAFAVRGSAVRCEFELDPALWPADADRGQLGQVVQNLVINAAQAMRTGTIRIRAGNETVESDPTAALKPGPHVWIEVSDSGPGIPPENLARIFDPYFTTKEGGSGLGLATVYAVVRKHNGTIDVASELGRGARFRVRLPAKPEAAVAAALQDGPAPAIPSTMLSGRILVMDDEETIRAVAQRMLRRLGFDVVCCRDGAEAVGCVRRALSEGRPFDCVLLDITVPGGMGGEEALRVIRVIAPGLRAVVSSGYSSSNVLARPEEVGAQGVVVKPYSMAELASVLERVLRSGAGTGAPPAHAGS